MLDMSIIIKSGHCLESFTKFKMTQKWINKTLSEYTMLRWMTHQKSIQLREFKSNTMEQLNKMNYVPQVNKPMQESLVCTAIPWARHPWAV